MEQAAAQGQGVLGDYRANLRTDGGTPVPPENAEDYGSTPR